MVGFYSNVYCRTSFTICCQTYGRAFNLRAISRKKDLIAILTFSILGMYAVQYTYFKTIELSSASFATIIQYTGPFFIIIYEAMKNKRLPNRNTLLLMLLTLIGVFMIVSNGNIAQLTVTPASLLWGIGSAISLAFYSVQPRNLLKNTAVS